MSKTPSVPLRLDLLQLAIGSTSLKVQPHGLDVPSLNSAAGGTQRVEKRLLRHKWNKTEHSREVAPVRRLQKRRREHGQGNTG